MWILKGGLVEVESYVHLILKVMGEVNLILRVTGKMDVVSLMSPWRDGCGKLLLILILILKFISSSSSD